MDGSLGGSKGNSELYAGERNMWTGTLVGSRAILNCMQEIVTCGQEPWLVQGQSEGYAGDINMSSGDLVGPRAILNDVLEI